MSQLQLTRFGLVVHPQRALDRALETLRSWSDEHGVEVVQVPAPGQDRRVAEPGEPEACDVIIALGGDGTALAALRTGAAFGKPVIGVACGSLGALTAVTADALRDALDRVAVGEWTPRLLPALALDAGGGSTYTAVNDVVVMRQGAGQMSAEVFIDGELFIRFAGDGLVIATPLGSSAYTLAAGGPVLAPGADGIVLTPLSPHGGSCPPLVAGRASRIAIDVDPGHGGARLELDGRINGQFDPRSPRTLELELLRDHATLVSLGGEESVLAGLRRRRVLIDSPRMLARAERKALADAGEI